MLDMLRRNAAALIPYLNNGKSPFFLYGYRHLRIPWGGPQGVLNQVGGQTVQQRLIPINEFGFYRKADPLGIDAPQAFHQPRDQKLPLAVRMLFRQADKLHHFPRKGFRPAASFYNFACAYHLLFPVQGHPEQRFPIAHHGGHRRFDFVGEGAD